MSSLSNSILACALLALGVASCGDDAETSLGSPPSSSAPSAVASQYADDVCSAGAAWVDDMESIASDLSPRAVATNLDPFVYVQQLVGDAVTATRQLFDDLGSATPPETEVGAEVSQVLDELTTAATTTFEDAATTLLDAPTPTAVLDVVGDVADDVSAGAQEAATSMRDIRASDPTDGLSAAFDSSATCQALRDRSAS